MSLDPISAVCSDDPYPVYRELRDTAPVCYSADRDLWFLSRYADVHDAINLPSVFSSAQGVVPSGFVSDTPVLITMDPPDHTVLRKAVQRAFTPKQIAEMEVHIREVASRLLDAMPRGAEVDAVKLFTDQLPLLVMTELLGVDLADRAMFKRCGEAIVSGNDTTVMAAAQAELTEYLAGVFAARRAEPRHDFITRLVSPAEAGGSLSDGELLGLCFLLLVAGTETTTGGLGTGLVLLDRYRAARRDLLANPDLMTSAVEEILRFDSPTQGLSRVVTEDVELYGTTIKAGSRVHLLFASANHDERQFPDPDRFDITRTPNQHLAFGFGSHYCVGASLARMEIKVGLEELLRVAPDYALVTGRVSRVRSDTNRTFSSLPMVPSGSVGAAIT
jgi:cytochrome P450